MMMNTWSNKRVQYVPEHIHENQANIAQLRQKIETLEKNAQQFAPQTSQSAKYLQRN